MAARTRTSWFAPCLPVGGWGSGSLLHALSWMRECGYEKVCFELDCKMVVDKVHSPGANVSELGSIIQLRQANSVAHCLARAALSKSSPYFYHYVPDCIFHLVINELQWYCFRQKKRKKSYSIIFHFVDLILNLSGKWKECGMESSP